MILLYGHGYIGQAIAARRLFGHREVEWRHHVDGAPNTRGVTAVINAAGYTGSPNVDECEKAGRLACLRGNVEWPLVLEEWVPDHIPVVHIGSGCVYDGVSPGSEGWCETDAPNFGGSWYSACRVMAERALAPWLAGRSYLLRVRMPFGAVEHEKNYLSKLRRYRRLISEDNSLSFLDDIADLAVWLARRASGPVLGRPAPGIYNATNPGSVTAREIVEMMGLRDKEWVLEGDLGLAAKRSNCVLDTGKLAKLYEMPAVGARLAECIEMFGTAPRLVSAPEVRHG